MTTGVAMYTDRAMLAHEGAAGHPERPERLAAILERLEARADLPLRWLAPRPVPREAVERLHDAEYVAMIESLDGRSAILDEDTAMCPASARAIRLAAGAAHDAVEAVMTGAATRVMCLVRPPGHHAEAARAMGFCFYNNIAIAAEHAVAAHGVKRVAVIDWDVHHGNGTQHLFEDRGDVLVIDIHQSPLWPGTGAVEETGTGPGAGCTVNVPLPPGSDDADYLAVFDRVVVPVVESHEPALILVSAGFDAHERDPLGSMAVTSAGFGAMCAHVAALADRLTEAKIILTLEGGYDLQGLTEGVEACAEALAGEAAPDCVRSPSSEATTAIINQVLDMCERVR